jgi:hypothetical protein
MKKIVFLLLATCCLVIPGFTQSTTWLTTGNGGLSATNFIGTTDVTPLIFKVNYNRAGIIDLSTYSTSLGIGSLSSSPASGYGNTAFGAYAHSASNGMWNTAVGAWSLFLNNGGNDNTAVGYQALSNCKTSDNTAIGYRALGSSTTGVGNMAAGSSALFNNATGNYNTAIGYNAGTSASYNNTISIGNSGWSNGYHNQAFIGNSSTGWIGGWVGWSIYSDARMKTKITEDVKGLDFITRLRPVTYYRSIKIASQISGNKEIEDFPEKYDAEKIQYSGFLAQEVEKAANDANYNFSGITKPKTSNDLYSLSYESFVVPLVKAVQEQQAMIEKQQQRIDALEKKLNALLIAKTDSKEAQPLVKQ